MDKVTIDTYNKQAKEYDDGTTGFWEQFPNTTINKFSELVVGEKLILNVGSGPGQDGLLLKNKGLEITCLDASETMVKMCSERGLEAVQGDLLTLPFADKSFDGVWAYTSLLHVKKSEIKKALKEIHRVLVTAGILGLGMIEGEGELYRESTGGVSLPRWFSFYTREELEKLLQGADFTVTYFDKFQVRTKVYLNFLAKKI
jgi:ubiquinone/menaquinone biosynthesis C-methylase UbiE